MSVTQGPWAQNDPTAGTDQNPPTTGGNGGPPGSQLNDMHVRLAKLESDVSSFRWMLGLVPAIFALVAAILIGGFAFLGVQVTRMDGRVSTISTDVQSLPQKINSNLLDLTRTLADAITASKQAPPQVLMIPAPQPPQAPPSHP